MDKQLSTFFKESEFACRDKCGMPVLVNPDLLVRLDKLREAYGKPLHVTSGMRCSRQNARAGGEKDSEHLTGDAADLACLNSRDRYNLITAALQLFDRVGIGRSFLHVGVSSDHDPKVIWVYN
jgi:uncharacterized protein YcbK (DUF882 family)